MSYYIRLYGDPVLRQKAKPVTEFNDALKALVQGMIETMYEYNGVGLAAPQIGLSKRLFVGLELEERPEEDEPDIPSEEELRKMTIPEKRELWGVIAEHVMINPEITRRAGLQHGLDGCLSLPGMYVEKMPRDDETTVHYQGLTGDWHELALTGQLAHVVQHEHDHLEGIMYIDRLPEEEQKAFLKEHHEKLIKLKLEAKAFLQHIKLAPDLIPPLPKVA